MGSQEVTKGARSHHRARIRGYLRLKQVQMKARRQWGHNITSLEPLGSPIPEAIHPFSCNWEVICNLQWGMLSLATACPMQEAPERTRKASNSQTEHGHSLNLLERDWIKQLRGGDPRLICPWRQEFYKNVFQGHVELNRDIPFKSGASDHGRQRGSSCFGVTQVGPCQNMVIPPMLPKEILGSCLSVIINDEDLLWGNSNNCPSISSP